MTDLDLVQTCGQLILGGFLGEMPSESFLASLSRGHRAGAILFRRNLLNAQSAYDNCRALLEAARGELPPFVAIDQEGGRVARLSAPVLQLPPMRELAGVGDVDLVARAARVLGKQLLALGFNVDFAPVLDVNTNPDNPIIGDRAFGDDAQTVKRFGIPFAVGLQSSGLIACAKHFPGHGDTALDSHLALPSVATTLERLREVELVPFCAAVAAGVESVMTAHIVCTTICPGLPATLSPQIMTELLRHELGFKGLVFSDDLEMKAVSARWSVPEAAVYAIRAGCDVVAICKEEALQEETLDALVRTAEQDSDFRQRCEQAARRSLDARRKFPPQPAKNSAEALAALTTDESAALTSEIESRRQRRGP